jgi:hypothetical protein
VRASFAKLYKVRDNQWNLLAIEEFHARKAFYPIANEKNADLKENDALVASCTYINDENRTITKGENYLDEQCSIYLMYYANSSNKSTQQTCSGNKYPILESSVPLIDSKSSLINLTILEKYEPNNRIQELTHQSAVYERQSSESKNVEPRDVSTSTSFRPWLVITIALLIVTLVAIAVIFFVCSRCKNNKKKLKLISFGKTFETKYIELSKWVSKEKDRNSQACGNGFIRLSQSDEETKELNKFTFESFDGFEFDSNSESDSEVVITRLNDKY